MARGPYVIASFTPANQERRGRLDFDRAEGRPVLFDVEVGGGDRTGSVSARPKPPAPGSMTAAPAPENRISGWARIEILAPSAGIASFGYRVLRRLVQSPRKFVAKNEGTLARTLRRAGWRRSSPIRSKPRL